MIAGRLAVLLCMLSHKLPGRPVGRHRPVVGNRAADRWTASHAAVLADCMVVVLADCMVVVLADCMVVVSLA